MKQSPQDNPPSSINQDVTADMVRQLITLLQAMLDVSGKGKMSEEFQKLMGDLNRVSNAMEKLTTSLEAITVQNKRLDQIEATVNFIADSLIEPQSETE